MAKLDLNLTESESGSQRFTATIQVEIYNQTYVISTEGDDVSEYVMQLADFVDSRMREVSSGNPTFDSLKVAIIAALLIAEELHPLKQTKEATEKPCDDQRKGMLQARGLWKDRNDLPDFGELRREWDRTGY